MKTIKLDRRYFRYRDELIHWCSKNIGMGGWKESDPKLFPEMPEWRWTVSAMFGCVRFSFREENSLLRFKEFLASLEP